METDEAFATEAPSSDLIEHILMRYHETHRRELPTLLTLAQKVETVHVYNINAPHGLTQALKAIIVDLEDHMRREEVVVFPALNAGMPEQLDGTFTCLRDDHTKQEAALNRIAAITHGLRLPGYACDSWRDLYAGLGKLAEDLDEHRYLEDDVLFPRFETCR